MTKNPYIIKYFLKQSRRDKTHEVLITPHKAVAAVWGWMRQSDSDCGDNDIGIAKRNARQGYDDE